MTRWEKWLLGGLGLSLAVNGLLVALLFFGPDHRHHDRRGPDVRIGRMEQHLSPEAREVLRASVDRRRESLRAEFEAVREARDGIARSLEAEPFDRAALEAAFAEAERHQEIIQSTVRESFIEAAAGMSREDRVTLAKGGERYLRRLFGPRRGDGPDGSGRQDPPSP